uniref:Sushi domain-containing protein n=2 Tax=Haplochromini TaxID=319058 RepID=A0A3P9CDZ8_9CICH
MNRGKKLFDAHVAICGNKNIRSDFSKGSCPSPEFPQSSLNGDPKDACFQTGSAFSLTCIEDNARRAGISSLRCKESKGGPKWTKYLLQCIHKPYLFIVTRSKISRFWLARKTTLMTMNEHISTLFILKLVKH